MVNLVKTHASEGLSLAETTLLLGQMNRESLVFECQPQKNCRIQMKSSDILMVSDSKVYQINQLNKPLLLEFAFQLKLFTLSMGKRRKHQHKQSLELKLL